MISMTASIPVTDNKSLEEQVMKEMNMTNYSYGNQIESAPKFDIEEVLAEESDDQLAERLE